MVNRLGDVVTSEYTDSHTVLKTSIGIADTGSALETANWTPAEFLPPDDLATIEDMATWRLTVDDAVEKPSWWDEMAPTIRANFERIVERMFVRGEHRLLLGGDWILLPGSRVHQAVGARIRIACNSADLSGADLSRADLSRANLSRANLYSANLSGANLTRANLSGANLTRADLSGADLAGADLYGADLSGANLSGADLYGANLSRANLSGANLSGADLYSANLYSANLYSANLSGANLTRANLSRANLSGADLYGANLSRADLAGADLSGARIYTSDPVPAGWVRNAETGLLSRAT
jgi:uncharacterized protein YjbI with pentapeptide repeats